MSGGQQLTLALALMAFAGNSLLCRLALVTTDIGPGRFTALRLLAGALTLTLLVALRQGRGALRWQGAGSRPAAAALLLYAGCFSYAYGMVPTATGTLLLFGAVQIGMMLHGAIRGERLGRLQAVGVGLSVGGLLWLLLPSAGSPPLPGAALMIAAGLAWGAYSLLGRRGGDPLRSTAGNFLRTVPIALPLLAFARAEPGSWQGMGLALVAGGITSGRGYALWYRCLPHLSATRTATVQLSVPVLAALGAVPALGEPIRVELLAAGVAVLGGIALARGG
ncbi:MAG: DMT family transporter [Synechococcaceae cyanobacterium]|nr:DMT family transporter [Synechococcaceae cyanobacterium]